MVKMLWWLTNIYRCKKCGYQHEYPYLIEDDSCPHCKEHGLWRQVMEWGNLVDYNPKKHRSE